MDNLLVDAETAELTAVLDYDWAHIGIIADEFVWSFGDMGFQLGSPYVDDAEALERRRGLLDDAEIDRGQEAPSTTSQMFNAALQDKNAERPSTIIGIDTLPAMHELCSQLCLFLICSDTVAKARSGIQLEKDRQNAETSIVRSLEWLGA